MPSRENIQSRKPSTTRNDQTDESEDLTSEAKEASDAAKKAEIDTDVDSILEEIDGLLEVNAEDFVKSFVQKGGQ